MCSKTYMFHYPKHICLTVSKLNFGCVKHICIATKRLMYCFLKMVKGKIEQYLQGAKQVMIGTLTKWSENIK